MLSWSTSKNPALPGLNLRQSLLYNIFGRALVFQDKPALRDFKRAGDAQRLKVGELKLIALDGDAYGTHGPGVWAKTKAKNAAAPEPIVRLASVPRAMQLSHAVDTSVAAIAVGVGCSCTLWFSRGA